MPKAYELPVPGELFDTNLFYLGVLCKRSHIHSNRKTLRLKNNRQCILCGRIDALERQRIRLADPNAKVAANKKKAEHIAIKRKTEGRPSRSKRCAGLQIPPQLVGAGINGNDLMVFQAAGIDIDHLTVEWVMGSKEIWERLQQLAVSPSVAELVESERRAHWATMPAERITFIRERARIRDRIRRKTDPEYALYVRQKTRRRHALMRSVTAIPVSGRQVHGRFAQFGHCCAYCGKAGDLHIEHVVPISKGGPHSIGNIIPACRDCNFSKRDHEVESWYRKQSFFCERRWKKICRVLGWNRSAVGQLALL